MYGRNFPSRETRLFEGNKRLLKVARHFSLNCEFPTFEGDVENLIQLYENACLNFSGVISFFFKFSFISVVYFLDLNVEYIWFDRRLKTDRHIPLPFRS